MALQFNRMFERHLPSVNKIYTYNILKENVSFVQTRFANEYRDVGHIARVMDFLVRGRQMPYSSAQKILGKIHERKDLAQYNVQKQTFLGGTPCRSLQVSMDGLGKVKKITITKDFAKLPEKFRRDFYVSAYFQALGEARNQLFQEHLKINTMAINELYDELAQFEETRDAQRSAFGTAKKSQAIEYQYNLLKERYDSLEDDQFEKIYGRPKAAMTPEEYPEHELLDMYMSRNYLNTFVPVTAAEEAIGPMNDPFSVEVGLFQRALEEESSSEQQQRQVKRDLEQDVKRLYAMPSEQLPQMIRETLYSSNKNTFDKLMEAEELKSILEFDNFLQTQRRTMFQLFASLSDERTSGYEDPSYAMITKSDIVSEALEQEDVDSVRRMSTPADYDLTV